MSGHLREDLTLQWTTDHFSVSIHNNEFGIHSANIKAGRLHTTVKLNLIAYIEEYCTVHISISEHMCCTRAYIL
jgi:hypothetical protein